MDSYRLNTDIRTINSQTNEQANVGRQRQLAYMTPENFMLHIKLYLGLKNDDISVQWTIVYMGAPYVFPYIILIIQMYVILYVYYMLYYVYYMCVYSGENKDYIIICICIPY